MAAPLSMSCPGCRKVLKGKPELVGRTMRCPACQEMFVFQPPQPAGEGANVAEMVTAAAPTVPPAGQEPVEENKYGVTNLDLTPRCPNCANPLESEDSVVCLYCGYNTMTRTWGKTQKTIEHTAGDWIIHLLPGFATLAFILLDVIGLLWLCLILPYTIDPDSWTSMFNSEPIRLWTTVINLFLLWTAGYFCYQRFLIHPRPPEKEKD